MLRSLVGSEMCIRGIFRAEMYPRERVGEPISVLALECWYLMELESWWCWLDCKGKKFRVSQLGKGPKASLAFPTAITPASAEANRKENEEVSHRWASFFKLGQRQKLYFGTKGFQPCPFPPGLLVLSLFLYARMNCKFKIYRFVN